jgi:PPP family 3-phenylpropionic acid transporter
MAATMDQRSHIRRLKLFYFLFIGTGGFLLPFINLFFERQGLNGTQIGLIGTIGAVTALIAAPFIGQLSDQSRNPRGLLQFTLIISAFIYLIMSQQSAFIPIALLTIFATAADSGIGPLSTMLALDTGIKGQEKKFGSVRVWGSLGWAIVVLLAGFLIEELGLFTSFAGYAIMAVISAGVLFLLKPKAKKEDKPPPTSKRTLIKSILSDRAMVGLAISLVLLWTARSGIWMFQALYLDMLGAGEGLIGITSMVGSIIELPAMFMADRIAQRRGSHQLLRMTYLLYAFTAGLVLLSPNIPTIIFSEAIGGIAYSFLLVSVVMFINERTPIGQTATVLALYTVTLNGLTRMFSSPLSGAIFDRFGPYWLYAIALTGCAAAWIVLSRMVSGERSSNPA